MTRIRRGTTLEIERSRPGVQHLLVEVDGEKEPAIAYTSLTGPIRPGDRVVLNTGAVALALGTGGVHFVIAVEGGEDIDPPDHGGHAMKLRYTPMQHAVAPVEETHRDTLDRFDGLEGFPVIVASLHSALAPAAVATRTLRPDARIVYVMTEGGALPIAFSESVAALKDAGLLHATITCGQAFGGDLEAVNKFSGLAAARAVAGADVVLVSAGPGNLGTASRLGYASIDAGEMANAVAALGGRPIVAPRISFADERERHRGISHHTLTALKVATLVGTEIAIPPLSEERRELVTRKLEDLHLLEIHRLVEVELGDEVEVALRNAAVPLASMGRRYADDPDYFRSAAAAAVLALRDR